jgi:hypothetical protein
MDREKDRLRKRKMIKERKNAVIKNCKEKGNREEQWGKKKKGKRSKKVEAVKKEKEKQSLTGKKDGQKEKQGEEREKN